ncbi:asparagine synthetase, putative [Entamoeba invadens IP1]|uniref:Asparagine synthetase, putative n=1 Tax=Entamoeba invadens IP1 TaxID=370355 RepID=A0A0A1TVE2_ENTIV|nr:asparagine synthetase, putative [Entamoeba invadens IP1]ELP84311.1 asparagine synthetase, putative [Entamoeba invadens IP1]|eukprot:XP_004183657.1 asparagine synthetase, putative [Entamoeba invadens IP1]
MEGFVIQIDSTQQYTHYNTIKSMLKAPLTELLLQIAPHQVKIGFTTGFLFSKDTLGTLNTVFEFSEIKEVDAKEREYLQVTVGDSIKFATDRFGSNSLLYETNENGVCISTFMCKESSAPNEWYEYFYTDKTVLKHKKAGNTIEEYYSSIFGERLDLPTEEVSECVKLLDESLSKAVEMMLRTSGETIPVLFSGGIDSSMIAYYVLLHCGEKKVELYNMACLYEGTFESPDRLCARAVLSDLKKIFPTKNFEFIEINASEDVILQTSENIKNVIYPNDTVMDLSITTATTLALISEGLCGTHTVRRTSPYVFCGQGADEQLGGYGRHRNALKYNRLSQELELDFCRLWSRNTERDDRVSKYCKVKCLYPFLENQVVRVIRNIPEKLLVKLELPENEGNKWILREVARKNGMVQCANFKKTAIQFGTRIAKVLNKGKKVSGADKLE